MRVENIAYRE